MADSEKALIDKIAYIIAYRESTEARREALEFVLRWVINLFPEMEIIVVEQDSEPKLQLDFPKNVQKIFLENGGLFNKGWALNYAVRQTKKEILVIGDGDVVLTKEDYLECFRACEKFQAVTPHDKEATNIVNIDPTTLEFDILNRRNIYCFAAMFFIIQREALLSIGGWDERFEGWGGEDDAITHLMINLLTHQVFDMVIHHVDHPRLAVDGIQQPNYLYNRHLIDEIYTLSGPAVHHYRDLLLTHDLGNPKRYSADRPTPEPTPKPNFVMAITTFNRQAYLQQMIETWEKTRTDTATWELIIADDGSTDNTVEYVRGLQIKDVHITLIENNRTDIIHQTNTIFHALSQRKFDLCFKCDDDVIFLKEGWDLLYWNTMNRIGYEHFCFYDPRWYPEYNLTMPIKKGHLICRSEEFLQGAFFTVTPKIMEKVGYFDSYNLGFRGYEHNDFTLRCCRAGFNVFETPFDIEKSDEFLALQPREEYFRSMPVELENKLNPAELLKVKKEFLKKNRIYIPYNRREKNLEQVEAKNQIPLQKDTEMKLTYKLADDTLITDRGLHGIIGSVLKKIYNFHLRRNWLWFPKFIKKAGLYMHRMGNDLANIDS